MRISDSLRWHHPIQVMINVAMDQVGTPCFSHTLRESGEVALLPN